MVEPREPVDGRRWVTASLLLVTDSPSTLALGPGSPPRVVRVSEIVVGTMVLLVVEGAVVVSAIDDDVVARVLSGVDELDDDAGADEEDDAGADDGVDEDEDDADDGVELDDELGAHDVLLDDDATDDDG